MRPSFQQWKHDIKMHTERVRDYGLEIFEGQKQYFHYLQLLPRQMSWLLIDTYLKEHDRVKSMTVSELQSQGYETDMTFAARLYKYYGKNIRPPFVDEMNFIEWRMKTQKLDEILKNVPDPYAEGFRNELFLLEEVADVIDVKKNRQIELGIESKPYDTANFFESVGKPMQAKIARSWEEERAVWRAKFGFSPTEPRLCNQFP
jgi:hypothetical protein